jgi:hypothetical protein
MKPLSKLHQETITKAKTEQDKVKAAAIAMIETPMEMIKAILLKHETAVIEVMRELEQAKQDTVKAEREACAKVLDEMADQLFEENERLHVENRRLIDRIETIGVPVGVGGYVTTTSQPEQEPVACPKCKEWEAVCDQHLRHIKKLKKQRTWVGLTDEEMHECWDSPLTPLGMKHARMIEAKLKEKNT